MTSLFAKEPDEICTVLGLSKSFQGKQIYKHLTDGECDFAKMTDLPQALRNSLEEKGISPFSAVPIALEKDSSGAIKLALRLEDSSIVECVLLIDSSGEKTACLSSQVGCAMGCAFCRTGTLGFKRNLKDYEIIEQFTFLLRIAKGEEIVLKNDKKIPEIIKVPVEHSLRKEKKLISHIVFMGMGEPLANLDRVVSAIHFLNDSNGFNMSYRRITVSTCGLVPGIRELSKRSVPVKLAVSLVCADDKKRSEIMPVNKTHNLFSLKASLIDFQKVSGRRFTFEYCLIHNVNTSKKDANDLISFCRGFEVIVNLIPFNPCPELPYETPSKEEIKAFTSLLDKAGLPYTIRISRGRSVNGACGQLAGKINLE